MTASGAVAWWAKYVRLLNVLTALVQLLAGLGSLTEIFSLDVPATFIAVYVMLFALLLLAFECRVPASDAFLKANFGFLYSLRGLGAYLLFLGLLDFGMTGGVFGYVAGATACFTAFVLLSTSVCAAPQQQAAAKSTSEDTTAFNRGSGDTLLPTYGSSSSANAFVPPPPVKKPTTPVRPPPPPPPVDTSPMIPPEVIATISTAPDQSKKGKNKK